MTGGGTDVQQECCKVLKEVQKYQELVGIDKQITEKKIRGLHEKSKEDVLAELHGLTVEVLYFDGKKGKGTLVKEEDGVTRVVERDHTTLVHQSSGRYLGFVVNDGGIGDSFIFEISTRANGHTVCRNIKRYTVG